jgi:hypothetical protein
MSNEIPDTLSDTDMIPDSLSLSREQEIEAVLARTEETALCISEIGTSIEKATADLCSQSRIFGDVIGCALQMREVEALNQLLEL